MQKMRSRKRDGTQKTPVPRSPDFDAGLLPEPLLAFQGGHHHVALKIGLGLYGPYSLVGQARKEVIRPAILSAAVSEPDFHERIRRVLGLYLEGMEVLSQRDQKPHVILCCMPQEVVDHRAVQRGRVVAGRRLVRRVRRRVSDPDGDQLPLFERLEPTLGVEEQEPGHQNLRRGLKAEAMQYGIPTQIVWPRTVRFSEDRFRPGESRAQDRATRAWNLTTALYHKAGGSPWRLAEVESDVCFVGVSFYRETLQDNPMLRTSMAQAFTAAGDGYVLRGHALEWDESRRGRSPHLNEPSAAALMRDVLELYRRHNRGSLPGRIVVHKTSQYWTEELAGFQEAWQVVPRTDFVALGWRGTQFYRFGDYPPLRGTFVEFGDTDPLLYTTGYIPYLRTYPGARIPQPLEVTEHHGDSPWDLILREILALTKMDWNTADFACGLPITVAFSRRVGHILAELPAQLPLRPEYRFYM
jgi:hypothetical protein